MRSTLVLVVAVLFPKTFATEDSLMLSDEESPRTSRGLFQPKMMDNGNILSPRMDYDEWTPLGRGDPLKNDPTYDYVPPVLERVHYWMDPSKRTPDPPISNSGVLVLGSSRTEPTVMSRTTPKYIPTHTVGQHADSRIDTMSLLDPFLKLMDVPHVNINPTTTNNYKPTINPNRIQQNYPRPGHLHMQRVPPQALQRPPYTMLMPPPPPSTSNPQVSFDTSTSTTAEPEEVRTQFATLSPASSSISPPTVTTTKSKSDENITTVYPTVLANTENVYKPVAIAMPETYFNESGDSIVPTPEDSSMVLPIISMFNNHKKIPSDAQRQRPEKHHQYSSGENNINFPSASVNNMKPPNEIMVPPSQQDNFFAKKKPLWNHDKGFRPTTIKPMTTTRGTGTLTTDPMFKHYKQPSEPVKGPFYLIIQGHSKVKTYGASKNPINGFVSSNEIKDDDEDRRGNNHEYYDLEAQEINERRRGKHLNHIQDYELDANENSHSAHLEDLSIDHLESLEETFGKSNGGSSKKRYLVDDPISGTHRRKRYVYDGVMNKNRKLLEVEEPDVHQDIQEQTNESEQLVSSQTESLGTIATSTQVTSPTQVTIRSQTSKNSTKLPELDEDNLNVESLIAVNDDYNSEDIISLLLKEEGQGSGLGNFVASIFARSADKNEEMK